MTDFSIPPVCLQPERLPDFDAESFDSARDVWMLTSNGQRVGVAQRFVPYLLRLDWTQEGGAE